MDIGPHSRFTSLAPATLLEGHFVVLSPQDGGLFDLSPVAAQVWDWLREERSFAELGTLLTEEYDVDAVTAERDLRTLLADLLSKRVISIVAE